MVFLDLPSLHRGEGIWKLSERIKRGLDWATSAPYIGGAALGYDFVYTQHLTALEGGSGTENSVMGNDTRDIKHVE